MLAELAALYTARAEQAHNMPLAEWVQRECAYSKSGRASGKSAKVLYIRIAAPAVPLSRSLFT